MNIGGHKFRVCAMTLMYCLLDGSALTKEMPTFHDQTVGDWVQCNVNEDCVIIRGACDEPECVNKLNSTLALEYYQELKASTDSNSCRRQDGLQKMLAVCWENQCRCQRLMHGRRENQEGPIDHSRASSHSSSGSANMAALAAGFC